MSNSDDHHGDTASGPFGHGSLLVFTFDHRCDADGALNGRPEDQCPSGGATGDIVAATVWRVGGAARCPGGTSTPGCARVLKAGAERTVLAVDGNRIVVRTEDGVSVLDVRGNIIREFPVDAEAAALSGSRLALQSAAGIEIYGIGTGEQTTRFRASHLEDLEGDILVTSGNAITLRRLGNGRTTTIHTRGPAHAQLEPPGLFVVAHTVTFTPMKDLARRLAG